MDNALRWGDREIRMMLDRRQMLQRAALGLGAAAIGGAVLSRSARAASKDVAFWASATLDIEDAGWKQFAKESGVDVNFTDNGNDPGPVVAKLAAGNANDIYDVGGLQGGSEKELARQGLIAPWDLSKKFRTTLAFGSGPRTSRISSTTAKPMGSRPSSTRIPSSRSKTKSARTSIVTEWCSIQSSRARQLWRTRGSTARSSPRCISRTLRRQDRAARQPHSP